MVESSSIIIGCSKCKSDKLVFLETTTRSYGNNLLFFNLTKCPDCGERGASFSILENLALAKRLDTPYFYLCGRCGHNEFVSRINSKENLSTDTELQVFKAKCKNCGTPVTIKNWFGTDVKKVLAYWYEYTENFWNASTH